jgi:broad specificity phosphatase PhoE
MSQRLSFLAHAATSAQRRSRFPDDDPIESIESGVVAAVTGRLGHIRAGWHAPERAAAETAEALGVATVPEDRLGSWPMGSWKGREIVEVAQQESVAFEAWRRDPDAAPPESGESLRDLLSRVGRWLDDVEEAQRQALVIADATIIRAVIVRVLDTSPAVFWGFDIAPLSLTVIQRANGSWRVSCVGCDPRH